MTDTIYYQYLPMIRNHIKKIVSPDDHLNSIRAEIYKDGESFAYAYFAELKQRFGNDEEVARYYLFTIKSRLSKYISHYYKLHNYETKHSFITVFHYDKILYPDEKSPQSQWDIDSATIITATPIEEHMKDEDIEFYQMMLEAFYGCADAHHLHIIVEAVDSIGLFLEQRYSTNLQNAKIFSQIAKKHDMDYRMLSRAWNKTKLRFVRLYPEVIDYLRTGDVDLITIIAEKIKQESKKKLKKAS